MKDGALILAIGDVHLGTSCSGLPDAISSWRINPADLTPAAALRLAVDYAIERQVDAVLFAGDVVESTNARFEAMAPLEESARRLLDSGIEVIAVAGNHDVEALPRLAALIDGFTLLGAGGRWEAITLSKDDSPFAQVVGWSFGEAYVRQSPLALLLREPLPAPSPPRSEDRSAARGSRRIRRALCAHPAGGTGRCRLRRLAFGAYSQAVARRTVGAGRRSTVRLSRFTGRA